MLTRVEQRGLHEMIGCRTTGISDIYKCAHFEALCLFYLDFSTF